MAMTEAMYQGVMLGCAPKLGNMESQGGCPHLDEDWLRERYWDDGMVIDEMADAAGVTYTAVQRSMDRRGVERRDRQEAQISDPPDGYSMQEWKSLSRQKRSRVLGSVTGKYDMRREWLDEVRSEWECESCGEHHPAVLEFHHTDDNDTDKLISAWPKSFTKERMKSELDAGEVLCANCHKRRHYEQNGGTWR